VSPSEVAPGSWSDRHLPVDDHQRHHGDLFPIMPEQCVVLDGEGRYAAMAKQLAAHFGRPDRAESWAKSLEASKWKVNFVSGFFDVNRLKRVRDWWLLATPDGEGDINIIHVSSAYSTSETLEAVELLSQINEAVRAAKSASQLPLGSPVDKVRWANRLIRQAIDNLPSEARQTD
jgi:hypothetical protein